MGVTGPMLARRVDAVEEAGELRCAVVSHDGGGSLDSTGRRVVAEEFNHGYLFPLAAAVSADLRMVVACPSYSPRDPATLVVMPGTMTPM